MQETKNLSIANFNCTFGIENEPMMNYFDSMIYPAFRKEIIRKKDRNSYFFDEVEIIEYSENLFALCGLFIKSTTLERKSLYHKGTGITRLNDKFRSDPFSIFIIFLQNHRMILIKNQKGSPDIRSFSATAKYILRNYRETENRERNKEDLLPYAVLNVVKIPSKENILKKLKEVSKIRKATFRLYQLNGDIPIGNAFNSLIDQLDVVGSKTGNLTYNSPQNHENVGKLIDETKGITDPNLKVEFNNGAKGTLTNDTFSQNIEIPLSDNISLYENTREIVNFIKKNKEVNECSNLNKTIYKKNIDKIKRFFCKKLFK